MHTIKLALHDIHEKLGARMVDFSGFSMPIWYSSGIEEHKSVRRDVGLFDVSHMGELLVRGPQALTLIQHTTSNDASKLTDGQAQYSCITNEQGGIVDDLIVYRITHEEYMFVVNAGNTAQDYDWLHRHNRWEATIKNVSETTCLFALQGPKAITTLQKLTQTNVSNIPYYHFAMGTLANVPNVLISNTGYTGSGGFEVYSDNKNATLIWNALMEAGATENIKPIGLGARDTLRLEKGFCLHGNDIDQTTSTLEAGLGWITKFNKDFIGRDALFQQKKERVKRKLIGFVMIEKGIPRAHYEIQSPRGEPIGEVTSGGLSPMLERGIGLGYIRCEYALPESDICIMIRTKKIKAKVKKLPFI